MYENVRKQSGMRWDRRLWGALAAAVLLMLVILIPMGLSMRLMYSYRVYVDELTASFLYGEENGCLTAVWNGEETVIPRELATELYTWIIDSGLGQIRKDVPEGDSLRLVFGDGTELTLIAVQFEEGARNSRSGVLLRYQKPNGKIFSYDTDLFTIRTALYALDLKP